jgi:uncharacterized protein YneF (UPF0154 family)
MDSTLVLIFFLIAIAVASPFVGAYIDRRNMEKRGEVPPKLGFQ